MNYKMLGVGNNTYVFARKITIISNYDAVKTKKDVAILRESGQSGMLVDASKHKTVRSVVVLDNGTHILSNLSPETLVKRLEDMIGGNDEQE